MDAWSSRGRTARRRGRRSPMGARRGTARTVVVMRSSATGVVQKPGGGVLARRRVYPSLLVRAFTLFNSMRVLSYLPTIWTIWAAGDSSQHSLITWVTWLGANLTMALWLFEERRRRVDRAVMVNLANATMCMVTIVAIVAQR